MYGVKDLGGSGVWELSLLELVLGKFGICRNYTVRVPAYPEM